MTNIMKKIYSLLFVMLATVCFSPASAKDIGGTFPGGARWGYVSYNDEIWISGDTIPDFSCTEYEKGHPMCPSGKASITITDAPWAGLQASVKMIYIHPDVKYIGKNAFRGFYEVEKVLDEHTGANNYFTIGENAFAGCEKLTVMNFDHVEHLGDRAFMGTGLAYAELKVVKTIGQKPFANCVNMRRSEVQNFVVVNRDIRPSVYISRGKKPTMPDEYCLSNIGFSWGGIEFLVLAPFEQRNSWKLYKDNNIYSHRIVFGGDFGKGLNDAITYWYINGSELIINCGFSAMPDYVYANSMPWYNVKDEITKVRVFQTTRIGSNAFKNLTNLREIETDSHLEAIGNNAFEGCTALEKTKFETVTKIGESAFKGCHFYTSPSFPKCKEVDKGAFENCGSLGVLFGDAITSIKSNAFKGCSSLWLKITTCTAPQVASDAFSGLNSSDITLRIPAGCASNYLGSPWGSMEKDYITDKLPIYGPEWSLSADGDLYISSKNVVKDYALLEQIPWYAYREYVTSIRYGYSNVDDIPNGVGENMFCDMPNLVYAYFETEGAKIGKYAFYNCPQLRDLGSSLNGVTEIGDAAFSGCTSLQWVSIDATCKKLGKSVFNDCNALTDIYCGATTPPTVESNTFVGLRENNQKNVLLHVPADAKGTYMTTKYWKEFSFEGNKEHGNITSTGTFFDGYFILYEDGFLHCIASDGTKNKDATEGALYQIRTNAKEIYVEGNISGITNAFKGFTNLTKVTLPSTVKQLVQAFLGCSKLTEVSMPGVTYLGIGTFRDCSALQSLDLSLVETIEENCFNNSGIASIQANNLKSVGKEAFKGCSNLTRVELGNAEINGANVFQNCSNLEEVTFNGRVLKEGMFNGCSSLKRVNLNDHVQVIEGDVFTGTALNTISYMRARPCYRDYSGYDNELSGIAGANITLYVPKACVETYSQITPWSYMNIQASTECSEDYKALPQYGFFADPADRWTLSENKVLTIESEGAMCEWPAGYDLHYHPLEEWMPYFTTVEVVGETTETMDDMIPSDRDRGIPGVSRIILGKNIQRVGRSFDQIYYVERVDCYAEDVPEIDDNAFDWKAVADNSAALHVSHTSGVKSAYRAHPLWTKFRIIDDLGEVFAVTLEAAHGYIEVQEEVNLNAVPAGTVLHLNAVPLEGYKFVGWENYDPANGLTVNGDVTVRALFESLLGFEQIQGTTRNGQYTKVLRNGQLLFECDGRIYTIQGQRIR